MIVFKHEDKSVLKGNYTPKSQVTHLINETGKNQIYEKQRMKMTGIH